MSCEYCEDGYYHRPDYASSQRPAMEIVGNNMIIHLFRDDGRTKEYVKYSANYCWNCGSKLGDSDD